MVSFKKLTHLDAINSRYHLVFIAGCVGHMVDPRSHADHVTFLTSSCDNYHKTKNKKLGPLNENCH
jgi:hypothetical protein